MPEARLLSRLTHVLLSLSLVTGYFSLMHLASPRVFYAVKRVSVSEFFRLNWPPLPFLGVALTIPFLILSERRLAAASIIVLAAMVPLEYGFQLAASLCWTLLVTVAARRSIDFSGTVKTLSALILVYTITVMIYLASYPLLPFETPVLDHAALAWVKAYATLQPLGAFSYVLTPFAAFLPVYVGMLRRRSLRPVFNTGGIRVQEFLSGKWCRMILPLSLFLSAYLSLYSYLPRLNPGLNPTGVDIVSYAPRLEALSTSRDPVGFAFTNLSDRPLFYLLLHVLHTATGLTVLQTLEAAPVIWMMGLTLSYYFLSLSLFGSRSLASLAALLSTASIQASVGLYSSYQANMVALIIVNILAGVSLSWREGFWKHAVVSALSFLAPLVHPYTSVQVFTMLATALLFSFWRTRDENNLKTLVLIVFSALLSNFFTSLMASGRGSTPLASAASVATRMVSLGNLSLFAGETVFLFTTLYSSFIANTIYLLLTLNGLTRLLSLEMDGKKRVFLLASSLTLLPVYAMDGLTGSRLFFNLPTPVFSALGASMIKDRRLSTLLIVASLCFSLQAVHNLGVLSPPA